MRDPGKVAPWLYRLAVTQSLLYRRKQGRRRKLTDRYAERNRPVEADNREMDPLGWLLADERRKLIRLAVSRLPKRDAELLAPEIHRGLELPGPGRAFGSDGQRGRSRGCIGQDNDCEAN